MIVALNVSIIIYGIKSMTVEHTISLQSPLPRFTLSSDDLNNYLAYSDSVADGIIQIKDLNKSIPEKIIKAHKSPVLLMKMNNKGTMIATTSCKVSSDVGHYNTNILNRKGNALIQFQEGYH